MSQKTTLDAGAEVLETPVTRAYLILRSAESNQVIDVSEGDEITIGRADNAIVRIDDAKVSRDHAVIACENGRLALRDLGSRNGTRLNTEIVRGATRQLTSGDVLWLGETELVVAGNTRPRTPPSLATPLDTKHLVVADPVMVRVYAIADRVAAQTTTVLLLGETGVGKEVVAEYIHRRSNRATAPFVRINCGALPENLIESELFGHEKGAFTGADRRKAGLLESAHGGTVFFDEIGELKLELQAKLLRAIETRRFMRVGGREELDIDARVIAATNRELEKEAQAGRFRSDLYFRLSTLTISSPPLRERPNEAVLLADLFVRQLAEKMGRPLPRVGPSARAVLESHSWPGNVRELRNVIERALVLTDESVIDAEHLPELSRERAPAPTRSIRNQLESVELKAIEDALSSEGGNQTRAARKLGISRRTLIYRIDKYQLRKR